MGYVTKTGSLRTLLRKAPSRSEFHALPMPPPRAIEIRGADTDCIGRVLLSRTFLV